MRLATEPDNDFTQVTLSGVYRAGVGNTVIAFSAATGQGRQDDYVLPYTINSNLGSTVPPVADIDGKVDTTFLERNYFPSPTPAIPESK